VTAGTRARASGDSAVRAERIARGTAAAVGVALCGLGVWAFLAPRSFFDTLAVFDPFNAHFVRDIGAFQLGLGAVLLLALLWRDALLVALTGVGLGMAVHTVSHVVDRHAGGDPTVDIPTFALLTVVLLGAAVLRWRTTRGGTVDAQ
jgi:hypothetical protein